MKKNLATFRYTDHKVIPLYASEGARGAFPLAPASAASRYSSLAAKRVVDIVFSLAVMVLGLPFYALIAALIKITSEGPVLFVQDRVGRDGQPFKFYKFRTMLVDCTDAQHRNFAEDFIKGRLMHDEENGRVFKLKNDPRVTAIGRFLRRTSLDELPQFINVLRGEMTLVGPRPPLAYELAHYKEWHRGRLAVKPGLTGLWQVSGRSTVPFDEMVMLDLYYIENWSLALDMKIILRTVPVMVFGLGGY
ncbi:MAG TPA: sugar transferase [Candidatus Krumholzibacteria bacterium]|nr:sugar transferase [Candidatus Krumholzibacteria bacterium]